ncbi:transposase [uncultured Methanobrevibacter sp.]|uniref:transposase n=1 Tax=uncultured Methanobrevibacter sp. TaxID=253161 RepID=UPI003743B79F
MSSNLNRNQHSVYILTYHLVLVIKYRRKVINEDIFDSLMVIFDNIGFKYGIQVKEANWELIIFIFYLKPNQVQIWLNYINSL